MRTYKTIESLRQDLTKNNDLIIDSNVTIQFQLNSGDVRDICCSSLTLNYLAKTFDFVGRDFHGRDFDGWDFVGRDFHGIDFVGRDFHGRDFHGRDFHGRDFVGIDFVGRDFVGWDFYGIEFDSWGFFRKRF